MQLPTALPSPSPKKTKKFTSKRNLLALILKKFLIFSKESFSYVFPNETLRFSPQARKIKETYPKKFLMLQETKTPQFFFIFSQRKAFLIFRETEIPKKFLIFQETEAPKKLLIFKELNFRARKMKKPTLKKLLIFQEIELSSLRLKKNFLCFRRNFQNLRVKLEAIL